MKEAEFLSKRIFDMTGHELLNTIALAFQKEQTEQEKKHSQTTYYRGHNGIRMILGELNLTCSHAKAQKIKDSGICREAIDQQAVGRMYKVNVELFKELFLKRRNQFNF